MHEILIKKVMNKLLEGDNIILEKLRTQYDTAEIVSIDSSDVGFFVDFNVNHNGYLSEPMIRDSFEIGDVNGSYKGIDYAVGFLLFIREGKISTLEGYTISVDHWPDDEELELKYDSVHGRNMEDINCMIYK